jgi:folate-binding protein YgfZ
MAVVVAQEAGYVILADRGVLAVGGADRHAFLQGLISNDIEQVGPGQAIYAAFLTPQGKYLHDFFIIEHGSALLLDCEAARRDDLLRRLKLYRLRSKISLDDATGRFAVAALIGEGVPASLGVPAEAGRAAAFAGGVAFIDPRLPALGARVILPRQPDDTAAAVTIETQLGQLGFVALGAADYDRLRLDQGVPDGSRDLPIEKAILLENNLDELNAISWSKGCYMGQELTARTRYRGLVRKRLMPVTVDGPLPAAGTPVTVAGHEIGEMRSGADGRALALLRVEETVHALVEGMPLLAGASRLTPRKPVWVHFPGWSG